MEKLIGFNENQDTPLYLLSHLDELKHKSVYFEVSILKQEFKDMITPTMGYNKI